MKILFLNPLSGFKSVTLLIRYSKNNEVCQKSDRHIYRLPYWRRTSNTLFEQLIWGAEIKRIHSSVKLMKVWRLNIYVSQW